MANQTKNKVTLKELAMFKLCPTMYKYYSTGNCTSNSTKSYNASMAEAEIFARAFSLFAEKSISEDVTYKTSDILCLTNIIDKISVSAKSYFNLHSEFGRNDITSIINGVFTKTKYTMRQIHQSVRGQNFKIAGGTTYSYPVGEASFIYTCTYRVFDMQRNTYRGIFVNEYKDFPKQISHDKHEDIIHYNDILNVLSLNKPHTDRVSLIFNMIRKINIQIETGYYLNDGLERIALLYDELNNYDFENPAKIKSDFCPYCKYFQKCY